MIFFKNFFIGISIGIGAILPGISSGVICVVFGIYEKLLNSALSIFLNFKKEFLFLLPIIIGIFCGIFLFSNSLNYLFNAYPLQSKSLFIGLILGCIPNVINNVHLKYKFKFSYVFFLSISLLLGFILVLIEKNPIFNLISDFNFYYLVLSGFAMSIGVVVPGVSSTVILMLFGTYSLYLTSISTMYLPVLLPIGIGLLIGCFLWIIITKLLFKKFYPQTFYSIIGFSLGSIFVLFPEIGSFFDFIIFSICVGTGFYISQSIKSC